MRVLGVIPARGGSKGLPRKNIRALAGKPLIAYSIEAGLESAQVDQIIVSTDDDEIAQVALDYGAKVPFLRPSELAQDETPIYPVLIHAVRWLDQNEGWLPDYVLLLQPTSPLRTSEDIRNVLTLAKKNHATGVVSVTPAHHHPHLMKVVDESGRLSSYLPLDKTPNRRQELPLTYAVNGALYLIDTRVLVADQTFYSDRTYAYIMPPERSLDIDSPWDFHLAELVLMDQKRRVSN